MAVKQMKPTEDVVDLHVFIVPLEHWLGKYHKARNTAVLEAVSAGFIRASPSSSLNQLRDLITNQLGSELVPESYIFLRSVGRCLAVVNRTQETTLTATDFAQPSAHSELLLLPSSRETETSLSIIGSDDVRASNVTSTSSNVRPSVRASGAELVDENNYVHFNNISALPSIQHSAEVSINSDASDAESPDTNPPTAALTHQFHDVRIDNLNNMSTIDMAAHSQLTVDGGLEIRIGIRSSGRSRSGMTLNNVQLEDEEEDFQTLNEKIRQRFEKENERLRRESEPISVNEDVDSVRNSAHGDDENDDENVDLMNDLMNNNGLVKPMDESSDWEVSEISPLSPAEHVVDEISEEITENAENKDRQAETNGNEDVTTISSDNSAAGATISTGAPMGVASLAAPEDLLQPLDAVVDGTKQVGIRVETDIPHENTQANVQGAQLDEEVVVPLEAVTAVEKVETDPSASVTEEENHDIGEMEVSSIHAVTEPNKTIPKCAENEENRTPSDGSTLSKKEGEGEEKQKDSSISKEEKIRELKEQLQTVLTEKKVHQNSKEQLGKRRDELLSEIQARETAKNNAWKSKYLAEKNRTTKLEEEIEVLRKVIESQYQKSIPLPGPKSKLLHKDNRSKAEAPSQQSNQRNMILKLQNEVNELHIRHEVIKKQLVEESTMKNFAEQELRDLRVKSLKAPKSKSNILAPIEANVLTN